MIFKKKTKCAEQWQLKWNQLNDDSVEFIFEQAEKRMSAIKDHMDKINERAHKFMNFSGISIFTLFSFMGFSLSNEKLNGVIGYALFPPALISAVLFLAAIFFSFLSLKRNAINILGAEPRQLILEGFGDKRALAHQIKIMKFEKCKQYQSSIDANHSVCMKKAFWNSFSYWTLWSAVALPIFWIIVALIF